MCQGGEQAAQTLAVLGGHVPDLLQELLAVLGKGRKRKTLALAKHMQTCKVGLLRASSACGGKGYHHLGFRPKDIPIPTPHLMSEPRSDFSQGPDSLSRHTLRAAPFACWSNPVLRTPLPGVAPRTLESAGATPGRDLRDFHRRWWSFTLPPGQATWVFRRRNRA